MNKPNIDVVVSGAKQAECTYKNVVLKGNHSFASQVTEPNCVYVIKWDFDLGGEEVTIPENCILKFEGGSLSNGTLILNRCGIVGVRNLFGDNLRIITNSLLTQFNVDWFGITPDNDPVTNSMNFGRLQLVDSNSVFVFNGEYRISYRYPVVLEGSYIFNGITDTSERRGAKIEVVVDDEISKPFFAITISTARTQINNMYFTTNIGIDTSASRARCNYIGYVFLQDGPSPGNLDSSISNCFFHKGHNGITGFGRGLKIDSCYFQDLMKPVIMKQTKTDNPSGAQNPPYDGRDAWIINTRFHNTKSYGSNSDDCQRFFNGERRYAINLLRNDSGEGGTPYMYNWGTEEDSIWYESSFNGLVIRGNYMDSGTEDGLIYCKSPIVSANIADNHFLDPKSLFMVFERDCSSISIVNNIGDRMVIARTSTSMVPFIYFFGDSIGRKNKLKDINIRGNITTNVSTTRTNVFMKFCDIDGFILKNNEFVGGNSVCSMQSCYASKCIMKDNVFHPNEQTAGNDADLLVLNSGNVITQSEIELENLLNYPNSVDGTVRLYYKNVKKFGKTEERPIGAYRDVSGGVNVYYGNLNAKTDIGFGYFDTDLGKMIYAKEINNTNPGTITWVDATGATV